MDPQWDRHWCTICLGIITLTSALVGAAFFSADLADLSARSGNVFQLMWALYRLIIIVMIIAVYVTMIERAMDAIFSTGFELAVRRTTRREAVRNVYFGMIIVIIGLLGLVFFQFVGGLSALQAPTMMAPSGTD